VTVDPGFFDGYLEAWSAHDVGAVLDYFTDDCVFEDVPLGRVTHGKAELARFAEELFVFSPDVHFTGERGGAAGPGGRYAGEWTMTGTHEGDAPGFPATHKRFSVRGVSVGELQGTKIKRNSDYWNLADLLTQVGLMPPPA
jgi:steroid delta-isomerase-like uncharacterized protein